MRHFRSSWKMSSVTVLQGHQSYEQFSEWSICPPGMTFEDNGKSAQKSCEYQMVSVALSETVTSEYAELEAFCHGKSNNAGIGISKSTIPLTISPRRLERGNAWFYHKKGLLCDGISFDSESMLQIHPYDRILVRYDRSRCRLEFRNNFCFIGKIDGVIAADLRFCCFTDGDGCWTITSSALPSPSEKTLGFDCEQTGPKNSGDTDAGPKSYVVCQSTRDPRPTESPDNGLGFDVQDLSNRVSTCKLSDGDRTDRLLCEFFSDYGRGLERAVVTTNEVDAVENPAISKNSFTLRRCMTSSSRQSFPAAGELFLDCQPLKDCPVQILSSSSILDVCDIDSALLTIPIASDETSFAAKSKIQDLGYHESQLLCTNTMLVSKPDSLNGEIIL